MWIVYIVWIVYIWLFAFICYIAQHPLQNRLCKLYWYYTYNEHRLMYTTGGVAPKRPGDYILRKIIFLNFWWELWRDLWRMTDRSRICCAVMRSWRIYVCVQPTTLEYRSDWECRLRTYAACTVHPVFV